MIKKGYFNDLLKYRDSTTVEKHLIHAYLLNNKLDFSKSPLLADYFEGFAPIQQLYSDITPLNSTTIKELENHLELIIPGADRKFNGAFFTPSYIVDFIIDEIKPTENETNLDPSCGCGAFLIGLADYYKNKLGKSIRDTVKKNIFGSDILPYNIRRAKLLLTIYALQNNEFLEETDFNLFCQDSLKIKWKTCFDNILGNPPYVKFQDLPDKTREYLPGKWTTADEGAFNLYFAFFELGYKLLKPSGRLGYITPNNYFTSLAGQSIRKYFHQKKCISKIIDFSHKKVFKAQTYTAITFLNKQENEAIMYDRIKEGCEPASFLSIANGSPNYLEKLNHRKWRLLKTDEQKNIQIIETIGTPIGKLFDICTGIATLKDELFFVDTRTEQQGFYTKSTNKGLFRIEKEITRAVYKIPDFKTQEETAGNNRRIICPYVIKDGTATPVPEARFKLKYPECYAYLHSEKEALLARDKHKVVFDPFFAWGRTQSLTHTGKKILTPTFSRQPRFLLIEEEDAFFTNGYGIYFKNQAPAMQAGISMEIVRKILNSCLMHYYVSKTSIAIQGGYPCYQKNFIEKFTIPEFSGTEIQLMETLDNKQEMDEFLIRKYRLNIESGSTKDTKYIGYIKQVK